MTPWTAVCQAPLSVGFPRQEHWSGLQFPSPRDLPDPGIEPPSPASAGRFFTAEPPGKPLTMCESESEVAQSCPTLCNPMDSGPHQAPLFMGFSRQEYWSGLPFLSPGDLPNPGMEPRSPALQADALLSEPPGKPRILERRTLKA